MEHDNMESITAAMNGNSKRLAFWQANRHDGRIGDLYKLVKSAKTALEGHWQAAGMIEADARRSAVAKADDKTADARERLRALGKVVSDYTRQSREVEQEAADLMAVPAYGRDDAPLVLIDLALAERMRGMDAAALSAKLLLGADPAMLRAAVRLPAELTGLTESMRAKAMRNAVFRDHPERAQEVEDAQTALVDTRRALESVWRELAAAGRIDLAEQVEVAGSAEAAQAMRPDVDVRALESMAGRLQRQSDAA